MPDITMCGGAQCPQRETCYRYKAKPTAHWQSWFMMTPIKDDDSCDYYWPVDDPKSVKKRKKSATGGERA